MQKYSWNIKIEEEVEDLLQHLLDLREVPADSREEFLNPSWDDHHLSHALFTRMDDAVARFYEALEKGQKIVIHGDYDADGVCGSSLLYLAITEITEQLGFDLNLEVFLPDREGDGYGVAMHTIERFGEEKVGLLVTVDCGISNIEELKRAHKLGIDTIICDHHQLAPTTPEHAIILHPLAPGEEYPNKHLCGTGVAFKFATGLIKEAQKRNADFKDGYEKWFLDLVAIATVTDVMPLLGENRTLEKYGLIVLERTKHPGMKALIDLTRANEINTETIGFRIGPRLNAAGRISSARLAFEAVIAKDPQVALERAQRLETLNRERQMISRQAYKEAAAIVKDMNEMPHVIVVHADHWNPGIVGLIAGNLVRDFGVPAFAFTQVGDHYVGSGRSVGGLHLVEAMNSCGDIFVKHGGHPEACGLTLADLDRLLEFKEKVNIFAAGHFDGEILKPELHIDVPWPINRIDWETLALVDKMEPFGQRNPRPTFVAKGAEVRRAKAVGKTGKHLKLDFQYAGPGVSSIGFNLGEHAEKLLPGSKVDVVYQISRSEWNGNPQIQVQILDLSL